jgi:hypothetical protein
MAKITVTHINKDGSPVAGSFVADLEKYQAANKNGFDWGQATYLFARGESYTTTNLAYGDIKLTLIGGSI